MIRRSALALLALAFAAAPARAFIPRTVEYTEYRIPAQMLRWPDGTRSIPFRMNSVNLDLMRNIARASDPSAAVQASLKSWDVAPIALTLAGLSDVTSVGQDGINLITFADTPENRDSVADNIAVTPTFWKRYGTSNLRIVETDIVFSARLTLATDGRPRAYDIQSTGTHELGHVLGLDHSPLLSATMWAYGPPEDTLARSLERDDLAGVRAIYGVAAPGTGAITGWVVTKEDEGVFGAHVVATDAGGITQVGALTTREGRFTIPSLPPGEYQLYAEPLNGAFTPKNLSDGYFHDDNNPLLTSFRTTFVEGSVHVAAQVTTHLDPIEIEEKARTITPRSLLWSTDWVQWHETASAPIPPGGEIYLAVYGPGVASVPKDGWSISGSDISIDTPTIQFGKPSTGDPYAVLPLSVRPAAPLGARNVYLARGSERTALTACVQVSEP
jgi:hypothetical protein